MSEISPSAFTTTQKISTGRPNLHSTSTLSKTLPIYQKTICTSSVKESPIKGSQPLFQPTKLSIRNPTKCTKNSNMKNSPPNFTIQKHFSANISMNASKIQKSKPIFPLKQQNLFQIWTITPQDTQKAAADSTTSS